MQLLQPVDEADAAVFKDGVVRGEVEAEELKEEEEQAAFEEYRQARLKQLRQQQKRQRFGQMLHMQAAQLVREVSHASAAASVVLHMFNPRLQVYEQLQVSQRRTAVAVHPSPCFTRTRACSSWPPHSRAPNL